MFKFGEKVRIVSKEKLEQFHSAPMKHKFANKIGKIIDFQTRTKNRKEHTVYVICLQEDNTRDYISKVDNIKYGSTGFVWYDEELLPYNKNKRIMEV